MDSKRTYTVVPKRTYVRSNAVVATRKAPAARVPSTFKPTTRRVVGNAQSVARGVPLKGYGAYSQDRPAPRKERSYGSKLGGILGHGVQQLIKHLTGFGDYHIKQNSLFDGGMSPPQIINSVDNGGFILRHREYIGDVTATQAFTNRTYSLNPGLVGSFPWLSQVAEDFEEYEWRGLVFEFKSTSSDAVLSAATSSALGSVIMATTYGTEGPFNNKMEMLNYEFANSAKPSLSFYHPIECKRDRTPVSMLYTRSGAVPTGEDKRLYDLGTFQIATEGMQATSGNCGELWATFELCLFKPKLNSVSQLSSVLTDKFQLANWSNADPLGTASIKSTNSSLGGNIVNTGTGFRRYQFPTNVADGNFLVYISWTGGTSVTAVYPSINGTSGSITFLPLFNGNTSSTIYSPAGGTTNVPRMSVIFCLDVKSNANNWFDLTTGGTLPAGANQGSDMIITQIDQEMVSMIKNGDIECISELVDKDDCIMVGDLDRSVYEEVIVKKRVPARTP